MKASAGSPQRKKNGKPLLVAPPVFVRILPANVGGHFDDGTAHVAKRLKSWVGTCGGGDVDDGGNASTNAPCVILSDSHGDTKYSFPKDVFGPSIRQAAIFNDVASPLLLKFLDEHDPQSVILFAYGQTGTGKTHTLMGPEASWDTVHHPDWGLFPRVVADVLRVMDSRQGNYSYAAHLSATEFYFCQGFDLLDAKAQVLVTDGTIVGAKQIRVTNASDVLHVLAEVRATRTTAHTKMNPASTASVAGSSSNKTNNTNAAHGGSSRSHCALSLRLRVVDKRTLFVKTVTFTCMDLAGAERQASNGNDHVSAMEAVMQFWRNPSNVAPCAQATIINYELACLRSAIVQAAENHRVGRKVTAPTQLGTAAVNYMHGLFDGRCHVANVGTYVYESINQTKRPLSTSQLCDEKALSTLIRLAFFLLKCPLVGLSSPYPASLLAYTRLTLFCRERSHAFAKQKVRLGNLVRVYVRGGRFAAAHARWREVGYGG